jgi:hypothetical protein
MNTAHRSHSLKKEMAFASRPRTNNRVRVTVSILDIGSLASYVDASCGTMILLTPVTNFMARPA